MSTRYYITVLITFAFLSVSDDFFTAVKNNQITGIHRIFRKQGNS